MPCGCMGGQPRLTFRLFLLILRRPPRSTLFPTRRSSDLTPARAIDPSILARIRVPVQSDKQGIEAADVLDRKSTRLNSSHTVISYAVFCLKKKKEGRWQECNSHCDCCLHSRSERYLPREDGESWHFSQRKTVDPLHWDSASA